MQGDCREEGAKLQWQSPVTAFEAMSTKWGIGCSCWTSGNSFLLCGTEHWHGSLRMWSLHPWVYLKGTWTSFLATCSGWPCLSSRSDNMTSRGLFQSQPLSDSVECLYGLADEQDICVIHSSIPHHSTFEWMYLRHS